MLQPKEVTNELKNLTQKLCVTVCQQLGDYPVWYSLVVVGDGRNVHLHWALRLAGSYDLEISIGHDYPEVVVVCRLRQQTKYVPGENASQPLARKVFKYELCVLFARLRGSYGQSVTIV